MTRLFAAALLLSTGLLLNAQNAGGGASAGTGASGAGSAGAGQAGGRAGASGSNAAGARAQGAGAQTGGLPGANFNNGAVTTGTDPLVSQGLQNPTAPGQLPGSSAASPNAAANENFDGSDSGTGRSGNGVSIGNGLTDTSGFISQADSGALIAPLTPITPTVSLQTGQPAWAGDTSRGPAWMLPNAQSSAAAGAAAQADLYNNGRARTGAYSGFGAQPATAGATGITRGFDWGATHLSTGSPSASDATTTAGSSGGQSLAEVAAKFRSGPSPVRNSVQNARRFTNSDIDRLNGRTTSSTQPAGSGGSAGDAGDVNAYREQDDLPQSDEYQPQQAQPQPQQDMGKRSPQRR